MEIKQIKEYVLKYQLGTSQIQSTFKCQSQKNQQFYLVNQYKKEFFPQGTECFDYLQKYMIFLKKINNSNRINTLVDITQTESHYYVFVENCSEWNLLNYLRQKYILQEQDATILLKQIIEGYQYYFQNKMYYRDMGLTSILIHENNSNKEIKLSDFGFETYYKMNLQQKKDRIYKLQYAPEMLEQNLYDVETMASWSIGIIFYQMLFGRAPFNSQFDKRLQYMAQNDEIHYPLDVISISDECLDFLKSLLSKDPLQRIKFSSLLNHRFLKIAQPQQDLQQLLNSNILESKQVKDQKLQQIYKQQIKNNNSSLNHPQTQILNSIESVNAYSDIEISDQNQKQLRKSLLQSISQNMSFQSNSNIINVQQHSNNLKQSKIQSKIRMEESKQVSTRPKLFASKPPISISNNNNNNQQIQQSFGDESNSNDNNVDFKQTKQPETTSEMAIQMHLQSQKLKNKQDFPFQDSSEDDSYYQLSYQNKKNNNTQNNKNQNQPKLQQNQKQIISSDDAISQHVLIQPNQNIYNQSPDKSQIVSISDVQRVSHFTQFDQNNSNNSNNYFSVNNSNKVQSNNQNDQNKDQKNASNISSNISQLYHPPILTMKSAFSDEMSNDSNIEQHFQPKQILKSNLGSNNNSNNNVSQFPIQSQQKQILVSKNNPSQNVNNQSAISQIYFDDNQQINLLISKQDSFGTDISQFQSQINNKQEKQLLILQSNIEAIETDNSCNVSNISINTKPVSQQIQSNNQSDLKKVQQNGQQQKTSMFCKINRDMEQSLKTPQFDLEQEEDNDQYYSNKNTSQKIQQNSSNNLSNQQLYDSAIKSTLNNKNFLKSIIESDEQFSKEQDYKQKQFLKSNLTQNQIDNNNNNQSFQDSGIKSTNNNLNIMKSNINDDEEEEKEDEQKNITIKKNSQIQQQQQQQISQNQEQAQFAVIKKNNVLKSSETPSFQYQQQQLEDDNQIIYEPVVQFNAQTQIKNNSIDETYEHCLKQNNSNQGGNKKRRALNQFKGPQESLQPSQNQQQQQNTKSQDNKEKPLNNQKIAQESQKTQQNQQEYVSLREKNKTNSQQKQQQLEYDEKKKNQKVELIHEDLEEISAEVLMEESENNKNKVEHQELFDIIKSQIQKYAILGETIVVAIKNFDALQNQFIFSCFFLYKLMFIARAQMEHLLTQAEKNIFNYKHWNEFQSSAQFEEFMTNFSSENDDILLNLKNIQQNALQFLTKLKDQTAQKYYKRELDIESTDDLEQVVFCQLQYHYDQLSKKKQSFDNNSQENLLMLLKHQAQVLDCIIISEVGLFQEDINLFDLRQHTEVQYTKKLQQIPTIENYIKEKEEIIKSYKKNYKIPSFLTTQK